MRALFSGLLLMAAVGSWAGPIYTGGWFGGGPAIEGYDPVAYFRENAAREGSAEHTLEYAGATWRFVSAANLAAFRADPEAYVPQYGGHCAYALGAKDKLVRVDPEVFSFVDGKLYLNYSADVQAQWEADRAALIRRADDNWARLLAAQ